MSNDNEYIERRKEKIKSLREMGEFSRVYSSKILWNKP